MMQRRLKSTCTFAQSDQSLRCPQETLHPWLSKMHPVKILTSNAQVDLNLRWTHMSVDTFPNVSANLRTLRKHAYSNIMKILPP